MFFIVGICRVGFEIGPVVDSKTLGIARTATENDCPGIVPFVADGNARLLRVFGVFYVFKGEKLLALWKDNTFRWCIGRSCQAYGGIRCVWFKGNDITFSDGNLDNSVFAQRVEKCL